MQTEWNTCMCITSHVHECNLLLNDVKRAKTKQKKSLLLIVELGHYGHFNEMNERKAKTVIVLITK